MSVRGIEHFLQIYVYHPQRGCGQDKVFTPVYQSQWRIQDFPRGVAPTPKIAIIFQIFAENCMKMKEFGPRGGASLAPPLGSANESFCSQGDLCPSMHHRSHDRGGSLSRGRVSVQTRSLSRRGSVSGGSMSRGASVYSPVR